LKDKPEVTDINRQKFLKELRSLLCFMRPADREAALRQYEARFDEAGPEGEGALLLELGSPVKQVVLLEKEYRKKLEAEGEEFPETPCAEALPAEETFSVEEMEEEPPTEPPTDPPTKPPTEPPAAPPAEKPAKPPVPAGRKVLAAAVSIPLIPLTLAALALAVSVGAIFLAPGVALGAGGVYFIAFGLVVLSYFPDILMLLGAGLASLAIALLLAWLGLWLLILGAGLVFRILGAVYRGILRGGEARG
jgi:hypothetical protein